MRSISTTPIAGRTTKTGAAFVGLSLTLAVLLAGCSTLPSSGPTAAQVVARAKSDKGGLSFSIVSLDGNTVERLNEEQAKRIALARSMASLAEPPQPIRLGPGDVLNVDIFEVGVALFSGAAQSEAFDPSAHGEKFPKVVVDDEGMISLPYIGRLTVASKTPHQVEQDINARLAGKSQNPQAIVTIDDNVSNTVYVSGDANKPGRFALTYGRERLLDAIAAAGGSAATAEDTLVQLARGGAIVEQRMGSILPASKDDLVLEPGDRIQLIKRPRSFTVFGATSKVSQVPFENGAVSLAEALARIQGPNDATADPKAVFIFRYGDAIDEARTSRPVIYRMNLLDPASYFLSQRFAMQDKDVIYIANAAANQPSKLVAIINQLFSPFVAARVLTNP